MNKKNQLGFKADFKYFPVGFWATQQISRGFFQ